MKHFYLLISLICSFSFASFSFAQPPQQNNTQAVTTETIKQAEAKALQKLNGQLPREQPAEMPPPTQSAGNATTVPSTSNTTTTNTPATKNTKPANPWEKPDIYKAPSNVNPWANHPLPPNTNNPASPNTNAALPPPPNIFTPTPAAPNNPPAAGQTNPASPPTDIKQ